MVNTAPQRGVDLAAYMGRWYEQARYDHAFERGLERVFTDYTLLADGWVRVSNSGRGADGRRHRAVGMASSPWGDGRLWVSFVPPYSWFTAPYHILYATDGYTGGGGIRGGRPLPVAAHAGAAPRAGADAAAAGRGA